MKRPWVIGLAVAAVYALTAVVTLHVSPLRVRPLYDSIGQAPQPYQFVNPPATLRANNVKPKAGCVHVAWADDGTGNVADSPSSPDSQAFVSLPAKAIAPHDPDTGADMCFTPLDPSTLPALPGKFSADGNVYRIQAEYVPSHTVVPSFGKNATILLRWAVNGSALFSSPDGKSWRALSGVQVAPSPQSLVSAPFAGNGYYAPAGTGLSVASPKGQPAWAHILIDSLFVIPLAGIAWFVIPRKQKPAKRGGPKPAAKKKAQPGKRRRR